MLASLKMMIWNVFCPVSFCVFEWCDLNMYDILKFFYLPDNIPKWRREFLGEWVSTSIKQEGSHWSNTALLIITLLMFVIFITIMTLVTLGGLNLTEIL
jgi:hypothetical protein